MGRFSVVIGMFAVSCLAMGCSGKLSRREATHQIDAMMKPHPVGSKKAMSRGGVPGFRLRDDDMVESPIFHLDDHKQYGALTLETDPKSPDSEDNLIDALKKMGYVTVQQEGPKSIIYAGDTLAYSHSRSVQFTRRIGPLEPGLSHVYKSGFYCYGEPDFAQCNTPPLVETSKEYRITGIVQDETHAKVNILISWKLTKFGLELKPYAASVEANEEKLKESSYSLYPALYAWEHFLNSHPDSDSSPAVILFQKFDDGWRIVNQDGKSEKDFE